MVTNLRIVEVEADAKTLQAGTAIMKELLTSIFVVLRVTDTSDASSNPSFLTVTRKVFSSPKYGASLLVKMRSITKSALANSSSWTVGPHLRGGPNAPDLSKCHGVRRE